jgi:xylulokinase
MSLLGIDVGTTGCKAIAFSTEGKILAAAYEEYDYLYPQPGWAELDVPAVWQAIKRVIRQAAAATQRDPISALAVSSLGEAVVPVTKGRQVLGPSILNFDSRGEAYLSDLRAAINAEELYQINGNALGNHYSLTKLMWLRDQQPEVYASADFFLLWGSFVGFMLGAEPRVDYSLANRTLLFDLDRLVWSDRLLEWGGIDRAKLPGVVPAGKAIGSVAASVAAELGLRPGTVIVSGAHDQNANAVGCGAILAGQAVYGMGTYICLTPVFGERSAPGVMLARGLNTEHHAVPGLFVSFIYNQGGALVKWFRDTFAAAERQQALETGADIYARLFAEIPAEPSRLTVLPHFTATGPPEFISDSAGVVAGLRLETSRGEILRALLEGATFYLKACVDTLPDTGITVEDYRAAGGGSKSDAWIQISADILGKPFVRPLVTEAGALGAAIIAGVGSGEFASYADGVTAMVHFERSFEPEPARQARYAAAYERYQQMGPLMRSFLRAFPR